MLTILKKCPFRKPIRLSVIYVEYDHKKSGNSDNVFGTLQSYLKKIKNCHITYFRVDNKYDDQDIEQTEKNIYTVGGDNRFREFSGWQKGTETINSLGIKSDLVLITNEMFLKPGPSFLQDYANEELLKKSIEGNKVIGRIDTVSQQYNLFGYDVSSWVCSNCLFVPPKAVDSLKSFVLIDDNIHTILKRAYDPGHLLSVEQLSSSNTSNGHFTLNISMPRDQISDIRVKFNKTFVPKESGISGDTRSLGIILKDVFLDGKNCPKDFFIRGIYDDPEKRWTAQSFLVSLPTSPNPKAGKLSITGFIPPEIFKNIYNNSLEVAICNDSSLYQTEAPINLTYKRWLVEWLTERWHSKFDINADTWELFTTKAAAILNESLLTAKLLELGYNPESYGDKKYY